MFFYLSRNRSAYTQLAEEIRGEFYRLEDIRTGPNLEKCRFLTACIKETLRISPSSSIALLREVEKGGAVVDGQFIPSGYRVGTSSYAIHHNPEYFERPHSFLPERWMAAAGSENKPLATSSALVPFSMGSRECIGKALSHRQLRIIIASVVWKYDFRLAEGLPDSIHGGGDLSAEEGRRNPEEFQLYEQIASSGKGPWLQFRKRVK